jgi:hypothetical protein
MLGMAISYYCPSEPAYAETASGGTNFAMATAGTGPGLSDAVFVLDMVTGRLIGAAYSTQTGLFNQTYIRNLAADFGLSVKGEYILVSGLGNLRSTGTLAPALGALYVGEMTSGRVNMYGFTYQNSAQQIPTVELSLVGSFPWKLSTN